MKVLITGATGQLGADINRELIAHGDDVVALQRSAVVSGESRHAYADLERPDKITPEIFRKFRPDLVIHFGAMVGKICETQPDLAQKVNVTATKRLAQLAIEHGVRRFVFASSAAVYTQTVQERISETAPKDIERPTTVYGQTKLAAEQALDDFTGTETTFVSLRIFNPYGPGVERSLPNQLMRRISVQLPGWEEYYRDFVSVRDVTAATIAAGTTASLVPGTHTVINVASGEARSMRQLVDDVRGLGIDPDFTRGDAVSCSWADVTTMRELLSVEPSADLVTPDSWMSRP